MVEKVRVRIAPSPTGPVHIGNVRTALFNWLFAKHYGGDFILRFEDTDTARSKDEYAQIIINEFKWLGLDWQEGPDIGGPYGPYKQTEKLDRYRKWSEKLVEEGKAYYCFCSQEELDQGREDASERGEVYRYPGTCRNLSDDETNELIAKGQKPSIRFAVPEGQTIIIDDMVRGKVEFDSDLLGDFVIVRPDGVPIYNFAVVIDDADMHISHVIRAEEHISNTPRQILIYEALGFPLPRFAHVSMVLGPDRTKLSKRHGAAFVGQYREEGYLPEALINFLAFLGWSPEGEKEIMTQEELIQEFTLDRIAKNPGVFDIQKLNWMNGHYIRQSTDDRILDLSIPHLVKAGFIEGAISDEKREWLIQVIACIKDHLENVSQVVKHASIFFVDTIVPENAEAEAVLQEDTAPQVFSAFLDKMDHLEDFSPDAIQKELKVLSKELKLGGKKVYMPIRVALTGQTHGPELHHIIHLLGSVRVKERMGQILDTD